MVTQLITVVGTLGGAILGAVLGAFAHGRVDRRRDAARHREELRGQLREACAEFDAAVTEMRGRQYQRHRLRTGGAPAVEHALAKREALEQRSRVTARWTQVQLLTDDAALLAAAERLALHSFDLHRTGDHPTADGSRPVAHEHRAAFLDAARRVLGVTDGAGSLGARVD